MYRPCGARTFRLATTRVAELFPLLFFQHEEYTCRRESGARDAEHYPRQDWSSEWRWSGFGRRAERSRARRFRNQCTDFETADFTFGQNNLHSSLGRAL